MAMKREIQMRPESAHSGGLVVAEVRSWYNDNTTFGMRDLIMIR